MSTAAQIAANQANSQKSTGPKTEAGIAASCKNNLRHGLMGTFIIQPWEKGDDFDFLRDSLIEEHEPSTATEQLLVERMAQHHWLAQRAIRLQELSFNQKVPYCPDDDQKQLALYIRYQTTHERAFDKCLSTLLKLRKEAHKEQIGFESQQIKISAQFRKQAGEHRKQELHEVRLQLLKSKLPAVKTPATPTAAPQSTLSSDVFESKQAA